MTRWKPAGSLAASCSKKQPAGGFLAHTVGVEELGPVAADFQRPIGVAPSVARIDRRSHLHAAQGPDPARHWLETEPHLVDDPQMHAGIHGDVLRVQLVAECLAEGLNGGGVFFGVKWARHL